MKDIRCVFGCHIYNQAETKIVDERKGYLIARVKMCCLRCGKPYEDIVAIPFPEWLQRKEWDDKINGEATTPKTPRKDGQHEKHRRNFERTT